MEMLYLVLGVAMGATLGAVVMAALASRWRDDDDIPPSRCGRTELSER